MASVIDDIKSRLDLVELIQSYIRLNKAGVNYKALCPFHTEKTPSFVVSPSRQIWHCFGCGIGGDHFKFVMQIEGLEFRDALELLAKRAGVELKREDPKLRSERTRLYQLVEEAARVFESVLHSSKTAERISLPLAYLKKRGLTEETVKSFRIGYAPNSWDFLVKSLQQKGFRLEEVEKAGLAVKSEQGSYYDRFRSRIVFPVTDASGRIVGFSGRIFESDPRQIRVADPRKSASTEPRQEPAKYINTPQTLIYDKSRILYGFDKAKEDIRKQNAVVLVEGQMDVVMSHQAGVKNAVAVSGTALTIQQLQILKRLASTIVSSFDRDQAGEAATKRSLDLAAALEFERKVAILPPGIKDPAEAAEKNPEIWRQAVADSKPIVQFFLETGLFRHERASASGKRAIASEVLPEIKILSSEVEKSHWIQKLCAEIGVAEEALWEEMKKSKAASSDVFLPDRPETEIQKNRRAQLESLLLGALILHPEESSRLAKIPRQAIIDEKHLKILSAIEAALTENIREHDALMAALPREFHEACSYLAFQAEVILERIESIQERAREIHVCVRELEREWARDKLRELSQGISQAEQKGEMERMGNLIQEFHSVAAKMNMELRAAEPRGILADGTIK